jgi:hypothetical protein
MILDEDQLPRNALTPEADGPVIELLRSKPMHAVAASADTDSRATRRFFILVSDQSQIEAVYQP